MSPDRFELLLSLVPPYITKQDTKFRKCISAEERPVASLRFLATVMRSIISIIHSGKTTLSHIISEECVVIWKCLKTEYLSTTKSEEDWLKLSHCSFERWNMSHVKGVINRKHIRIQCLKFTGTQCYNYKGFHSMVLCNTNYCFIMSDFGKFGSNNNSSILAHSEMGNAFENKKLRILEA